MKKKSFSNKELVTMAKRIVNKAERNAERYDAKETGYQLYEGSLKGNKFDRLMPLIVSELHIGISAKITGAKLLEQMGRQ